MTELVDLHHHLLPGLDDGPSTFEETVAMLYRAAGQGVRYLVATPHLQPGVAPFDWQAYQQALVTTAAYIQSAGLPLQLMSGAEVFYTHFTIQHLQQGLIPTLGDSWHVLVEFEPTVRFSDLMDALEKIGNAGKSVVLAHAERYRCLRMFHRMEQVHELPHVSVQLNADMFLRALSSLSQQWLKWVMDRGLADIVASDAHNDLERPCNLWDAYQAIQSRWDTETAIRLCARNPLDILAEKAAKRR